MGYQLSVLELASPYRPTTLKYDRRLLQAVITLIDRCFAPSLLSYGQPVDSEHLRWRFIFRHSGAAFLAYRLASQALHPLPVKGGLAYGLLEFNPDQEKFTGPTLERAQAALNASKSFPDQSLLYDGGYQEDLLVNVQLANWRQLKSSISAAGYFISQMLEWQSPLYLSDCQVDVASLDFSGLLQEIQIIQAHINTDSELSHYSKADLSQLKPAQALDLLACFQKSRYHWQDILPKGYASPIAKAVGTSRQNIDYHFKNSQLANERSLAANICLSLTREEGYL
ncbi:hypothetical protein AWM75_03810 [Aerococcus urinaehominis]|uniref:Uncharacterized protein n=1 Tax=Aerococcus urinaehominis TaxID=128944 RepID=A0A0X8FLB4_9LACT|nr:hypothetical protein [Aerococcus urinaehominis]AMB99184.1 hypothetical protein AWM75_03810 [Aerococcus urinaehominis]SDM06686.1 hypothetical protein SAMN04487985_104121 [Aerococcus urinaehominis]